MTTYYLIRSSARDTDGNIDVTRPAPWPIVADDDGNIISGRPDADRVVAFMRDHIVGENLIFATNAKPTTDGLNGYFTVGTVADSIDRYLPGMPEERLAEVIGKLRASEALYRAALEPKESIRWQRF